MNEWDESKHPRDKAGKFTEASGAGKTWRQNANYSEILARDREFYSKHIDSLVLERLSSVKEDLKKKGYVVTIVNDYDYKYIVRIDDDRNDLSYEVLDVIKIK